MNCVAGTDSAKYFFIFWAILFITSVSSSSVFRFVACFFPNAVVAFAVGGTVLLMLLVNSGYAILRKDIPGYGLLCVFEASCGVLQNRVGSMTAAVEFLVDIEDDRLISFTSDMGF